MFVINKCIVDVFYVSLCWWLMNKKKNFVNEVLFLYAGPAQMNWQDAEDCDWEAASWGIGLSGWELFSCLVTFRQPVDHSAEFKSNRVRTLFFFLLIYINTSAKSKKLVNKYIIISCYRCIWSGFLSIAKEVGRGWWRTLILWFVVLQLFNQSH